MKKVLIIIIAFFYIIEINISWANSEEEEELFHRTELLKRMIKKIGNKFDEEKFTDLILRALYPPLPMPEYGKIISISHNQTGEEKEKIKIFSYDYIGPDAGMEEIEVSPCINIMVFTDISNYLIGVYYKVDYEMLFFARRYITELLKLTNEGAKITRIGERHVETFTYTEEDYLLALNFNGKEIFCFSGFTYYEPESCFTDKDLIEFYSIDTQLYPATLEVFIALRKYFEYMDKGYIIRYEGLFNKLKNKIDEMRY